ncbi:MAG: hypothetical protein JO108_07800 [Acidobacteriaceae bacterium]|nr:hypothetical protein [Acidobacteriaceae bacterium]
MKTLWKPEAGHLKCTWSEIGGPNAYQPGWIEDISQELERSAARLPDIDFQRLSPFGVAEWYALDPGKR